MKQIIKLTENDLREMVKSVLNESFENQELGAMVKEHGGLDSARASSDARYNNHRLDLQQAHPTAYIPKEIWDKISLEFNLNYPISQQVLCCKDGGAIILDLYRGRGDSREFIDAKKSRLHNYWDNHQYRDVSKEDMDKYRELGHKETDQLTWYNQDNNTYTAPNFVRRHEHGARRGVKKVRGQK